MLPLNRGLRYERNRVDILGVKTLNSNQNRGSIHRLVDLIRKKEPHGSPRRFEGRSGMG